MNKVATDMAPDHAALDRDLAALATGAAAWARTPTAERIAVLSEIKDRLLKVSEGRADTAARRKLIPAGSPHQPPPACGGQTPDPFPASPELVENAPQFRQCTAGMRPRTEPT